VEVARSEICSVDEEGEVISERPGPDMNNRMCRRMGRQKWSDVEGKGKGKAKEATKKVRKSGYGCRPPRKYLFKQCGGVSPCKHPTLDCLYL